MDRFGHDVRVMKEDESHFRVTLSVAVSNQFCWIFGLGKAIRIVSPKNVKEGMKKALAEISARYELAFLPIFCPYCGGISENRFGHPQWIQSVFLIFQCFK